MAGIAVLRQKYQNANLMDLLILQQLREDLRAVKPEEVHTEADHRDFLALVHKFRSGLAKSDELKGDNYPALLSSLLSVGEDGVYSNNLRFLYELIQNVDDCDYENPSDARLNVQFDTAKGRIVLEYNERGFTPYNVFAITGIAEAAKNISAGKVEIGEKGIGFKSVFGVADKVLIQSGLFSFELNKENFTIPVAQYDNYKPVQGTRLTLFVKTGRVNEVYRSFFSQYCKKDALFNKNPLLFLNKLTSLRLYYDYFSSMTFTVDRNIQEYQPGLTYEDNVKISVELRDRTPEFSNGYQQSIVCRRYSCPVIYDRKACQSRYGINTQFQSKQMLMQVVIPDVDELYGNDPIQQGTLYSFLPTQIRLTVPMACHIPMKLDGSREFVDPQGRNLWFVNSFDAFSDMMKEVLTDLAHRIGEDIVHYIPTQNQHLFVHNSDKTACLLQDSVHNKTYLELPIFKTVENHFCKASEVFCFSVSEEIPDPETTYLLLGLSKELFLPSKRARSRNVGISCQTKVAEHLFRKSVEVPSITKDCLAVLEQIPSFNFSDSVNTLYMAWLSLEQIRDFSKVSGCAKAFRERSVGQIKKAKVPAYKVGYQGLEIKDVRRLDGRDPIEENDFEENASKYLKKIGYQCVLISEVDPTFFFAAENMLVLSEKDPLRSLSEFCGAVDERGTFAAALCFRSASRRLNEASEDMSVKAFMKLLTSVRKLIRDSFGKGVYEKYIDLINQSGSDPDRYLNELLQNADDCVYPDEEVPTFSLAVESNGRVINTRYNECGFNRENVRSITAIGESTKKRMTGGKITKLDDIGEKGIGFKAVFGVADRVEIHSGDFHFALKDTAPTIPEVLEGTHDTVEGTQMCFSLKKQFNMSLISEENLLNLCLCLRKLRNLRIGKNTVTIEDNGTTRIIRINKKEFEFAIIRFAFEITDTKAIAERGKHQRQVRGKQEIRCYVPVIQSNGKKRDYYVYSGLPTKIVSKCVMAIDAPYDLTTDRGGILSNNWNSEVTKAVHKAIAKVLELQAELVGADALRHVNYRKEGSTYILDMFSDSSLNSEDLAWTVKSTHFLPTFDSGYLAKPQDLPKRIPGVMQFLLLKKGWGQYNPKRYVRSDDSRYEMSLAALGIKEESMNYVLNVLKPSLTQFMGNEVFRTRLYNYLMSHLVEIANVRLVLKSMPIVPVKGKYPGITIYISFCENIYAKDDMAVSPDNYYILETERMSRKQFNDIFGSAVSEMNSEMASMYYRKELEDKIDRTSDDLLLYAYLMNEFNSNPARMSKVQDTLQGRKDRIPLKNEMGELRRGRIYSSDAPEGFYEGTVFQKHIASKECDRFARLIGVKNISEVYYEDIDFIGMLTEDDVDFLQSVEDLTHRFEILALCKRKKLIPGNILAEGEFDGLDDVEGGTTPSELEELFNEPVGNPSQFKKHMEWVIANSATVYQKKVERTIRMVKYNNGKVEEYSYAEIRVKAIGRYSLTHRGLCVCQMCRKAVRPQYIEVKNVFRRGNKEKQRYWTECGMTLCMMCSKHYEELRQNTDIHSQFLNAIRKANRNQNTPIDIPIGKEKIWFSQKHIAELQEIIDAEL